MRLKFYSLSFCAGSLPDYVKSTKKLRNLASYEISSSLLEFDNTNISYELNWSVKMKKKLILKIMNFGKHGD